MNEQKCPKCGAPRERGPECPACGVIYAKAEQDAFAKRKKMDEARRKADAVIRNMQSEKPSGANLIDCPTCGRSVSKNAPTCPNCGEIINKASVADPQQINKAPLVGYLGSAIMAAGVFCPLVSIPIAGSINYFKNGEGDGTFLLFLAAASVAAIFWKRFKFLIVTGGAAIAILTFDLWNFFHKMSLSKADMQREMAGNPFGGLAEVAMQSIQLQWGWAVMFAGAAMLIVAWFLSNKE